MNTQWLDKAKCRDMNPREFDLVDRRIYQPESTAEAERLCSGCPVTQECASDAVAVTGFILQTTTRAGVWVPDRAHENYFGSMDELIAIAKGNTSC